MAEYNSSEDRYSVPDNNTEEFEQQLQQKHIQQREQLEGGGPVEETGSIEEAGSTPTADSSTQPRETAKAVKGGKVITHGVVMKGSKISMDYRNLLTSVKKTGMLDQSGPEA